MNKKRHDMYLRDAIRFRRKVFALVKKGVRQIEIARKLGVSRQRINQIIHAEKHLARTVIYNRVVNGIIPKASALKCVDCGTQAKEYDHRDYSKPKDVDAVCEKCHTKRTPHWHTNKFDYVIRGKIKEYLNSGLSQSEIGRKLDISRQRVWKIINGQCPPAR